MKFSVTVKPNSRKESVEQIDESNFIVKVHAPPHGGKANERLINLLSKYIKMPPSRLTLLKGHTSKRKIIEVAD